MDVICVHGIVSQCCASPTSAFQCQALLNWPPLIDGDAGLAVEWLKFTLAPISILALAYFEMKGDVIRNILGVHSFLCLGAIWWAARWKFTCEIHSWQNIQGLWQLSDIMGQEFLRKFKSNLHVCAFLSYVRSLILSVCPSAKWTRW